MPTGVVIVAMFALQLVSCTQREQPAPIRPAYSNDEEYAWRLFMEISRQAIPDKAGYPDPNYASIQSYSDDRGVVWETWALSTRDHYTYSEVFPKGELVHWSKLARPEKERVFVDSRREDGICAANVFPKDPETNPEWWRAARVEVRVNEIAYASIRDHKLNQRGELKKLFDENAYTEDPLRISFLPRAQIVKSRWKEIAERDKPAYHWRTVGGKPHGLIALHVISKEDPNWFWSTFIHESEADGGRTHRDLVGTKWQHYYLIGIQSEFADAHGRFPTQLRNRVIEIDHRHVSCITCHAYARVDKSGNEPAGVPPNTCPIPESGAPHWEHFWEKLNSGGKKPNYKMRCVPTDFVWSIVKHSH